jgi:hypothetical protein
MDVSKCSYLYVEKSWILVVISQKTLNTSKFKNF